MSEELEKNLESIRKSLIIIRFEVIAIFCLISFFLGLIIGKTLGG